MHKPRINDDQIDAIKAMWPDLTISVKEMSRQLKTSASGIAKLAGRIGLPERGPVKYTYNPNSPWTDSKVKQAHDLYIVKGHSASETALLLGPRFTRRSVIGQAYRRGWNKLANDQAANLRRLSPSTTYAKRPRPATADDGRIRPAPAFYPAKLPFEHAFQPLPGSMPKPWEQCKPTMCNWPIDLPGMIQHYCCEPVVGRQWCSKHYATGIDRTRGPLNLKSLSRVGRG